MKSLLIFLTAFFYLSVFSLQAQKDTSSAAAFLKNELLLDISPAIKWAVTTGNEPESVAFTYKRYLKPEHVLRVSYRSIFYSSQVTDYYGKAYSYKTADTILLYDINRDETIRNFSHSIRAGYEYHFGKKRVQGIIGVELINGIADYNFTQYNQALPNNITTTDFSQVNNFTRIDTFYDGTLNSNYFDNNYRVVSYTIGIAPIVGFKIRLSNNNKWYLNANMILNAYYQIPMVTKIYSGNEQNNQKGFRSFTDAPITDVSICYRFGNK